METSPMSAVAYHPPTGRSAPAELAEQACTWVENPVLHEVLEAVEGFVLLINRQHQILVANVPFLKASLLEEMLDLRGLRLGEVLGCIHVAEGSDGCGTSPACAQCGVAQAVSCVKQEQVRVTYEALLTRRKGDRWEALELRVHASPFPGPGGDLLLIVCQDISAEKRREVLESVFFHDVLNTLGGLRGWVNVLKEKLGDPARAMGQLDVLSDRVIQEVRSQRLITQAERGELVLKTVPTLISTLVREWQAAVQQHPSAEGKILEIQAPTFEASVLTDPDLLRRVLVNMTLNALEATPSGGRVAGHCQLLDDRLHFSIHNPGFIPPEIQGRIFQRSFSTKATRGRGLGTYSMKLLGETYLKGQVAFTTDPSSGTCFSFALPL